MDLSRVAYTIAQENKKNIPSISVLSLGAKGDGVTDDKKAIDDALSKASDGGIVELPFGKTYVTTGGHVIPKGVTLRMNGAVIKHIGDNICFDLTNSSSFNLTRPSGIEGGSIEGNDGANAVGICYGNAWGQFTRNTNIRNYANGIGVSFLNKYNWAEGVSMLGVKVDSCKTGIRFKRTTGTSSFAYTSILDVSINVPENGIGIDFGADSAGNVYFYNSDVRATIWTLGENSIGVRIGPSFTSDNVRMYVTGEIPSNATGTVHKGLVNEGGTLKAYGHFRIKDTVNDLTLGRTTILAAYENIDTAAGTQSGTNDVFKGVLNQNMDVAHNAMFGYIIGTNKNIPFVSGYNAGDAFRVYATPYNSKPADAPLVFSVSKDGNIKAGAAGNQGIMWGTGKPSTVTAGIGTVYIRKDVTGGPTQIYVKTVDGGTTGWAALEPRRTGDTASRPSGMDVGVEYYDTTLKKPIYWDGLAWRDAMGTQV